MKKIFREFLKKLRERQRGFSLVEMLVSVVIFIVVAIAVYFFFDRGQWLYLQSDRKNNMQDNARLSMEQMERDLRLASYGVPKAGKVGAPTIKWTPSVFLAETNQIGFRGDVDNGSTYVTQDITSTSVWTTTPTKYPANTNIVISNKNNTWFDTVSQVTTSVAPITISPGVPSTFTAKTAEVYTIEEVFYRLTTGTVPDQFNVIERQVNNPQTPSGAASGAWIPVATNIQSLTFEYFQGTNPLTAPVTGTSLNQITRIVVTLVAKERSDQARQYQTITLKSEILLRNSNPI